MIETTTAHRLASVEATADDIGVAAAQNVRDFAEALRRERTAADLLREARATLETLPVRTETTRALAARIGDWLKAAEAGRQTQADAEREALNSFVAGWNSGEAA